MLSQSNKTDLQENFHSNIIPALAKIIANNEENLRVRIHAISCLVNFLKGLVNESEGEEVDDYSDIIKPYSKDVLALLAEAFNLSLKIDNKVMQEITLSAISLIATILDSEFEPFYKDIVPFLKDLLVQEVSRRNENNKNLIAQIVSTISFICSSINKSPETYMSDFIVFCNMFEQLLYNLKEEDPEVVAIFKAFSHISTSMKTNFYPYLEKIFPILAKYATADIDIKLEDVDLEKVTNEKSTTPGFVLQTGGVNKKLSLKTFTLQNKVMALDVLKDICLSMETAFFPYVEQFLTLIKPMVNVLYSRKIRKITTRSFEAAVYACENEKQQKQVFDYIFASFLDKFENDVEIQMIRDLKYNLKVFIHIFTEVKSVNVVNQEQIKQLYMLLNKTVTLMEERKAKIKDTVKQEDAFDENDQEGFSADIEVLNEVNRRVMELSGVIFKLYKEDLTDLVNSTLSELFFTILKRAVESTKDDQELVYGLCFFTDVMQYGRIDAFKKIAPEFMKICQSTVTKNEDVIQNIIFGYGIFVERSSNEEYVPYAELISNSISNVITRKVTEENGQVFDNAIASLGKVLYFKTMNNEEGHKLASRFYDMLPLKNDLEESKATVKLLCQQFLSGNPLVANSTHYASFKKAFKGIRKLDEDESILDEEAKSLMMKVEQLIN